jgi:hypothetical protein
MLETAWSKPERKIQPDDVGGKAVKMKIYRIIQLFLIVGSNKMWMGEL